MERKPPAVKSSNIVSVGYDAAAKRMEVEFSGGKIYEYEGVGADDHASFVHDKSPGGHFAAHIRNNFKSKKLESK